MNEFEDNKLYYHTDSVTKFTDSVNRAIVYAFDRAANEYRRTLRRRKSNNPFVLHESEIASICKSAEQFLPFGFLAFPQQGIFDVLILNYVLTHYSKRDHSLNARDELVEDLMGFAHNARNEERRSKARKMSDAAVKQMMAEAIQSKAALMRAPGTSRGRSLMQ